MLYIISAPSGAGKTSLVRALLDCMDNLVISVSYTTRPPRPDEIDGVNYHFISDNNFRKLIDQNDFLEYAQVFDYLYGTSRAWVAQQIQAGKDVILEIDWQGAQQIRNLFKQSLSIFILPPSLAILAQRLKQRAQDSIEVIEKRMQQAKSECRHYTEFEYMIINDVFETALKELSALICAERLRVNIQQKKYQLLLSDLLAF